MSNSFFEASYEHLKKLQIGSKFEECEHGQCVWFDVIEIPKEKYNEGLKENQLRWKGKAFFDGAIVDFLRTENLLHYSPKIYIDGDYPPFGEGH